MIREGRRKRPRTLAALIPLALLSGAALAAPPPGVQTPASLAAAVKSAQALVETVRGVPFKSPVASSLLPEKDLEKVLAKKLVEDLPTTFDRYAATLAAIGLIEPVPDLQEKITRLYTRQVVGFYDPAERRFYVVPERSGELAGTTGSASVVEEALLVHELTHALQDQRIGLDRKMRSLKDSTDGLLALEAFLEGEATVVMTDALVSKLPEAARAAAGPQAVAELLSGLANGEAAGVEGGDGVPEFFVKELLFPYSAGTAWIQHRKGAVGWGPVDAAYKELPETTAEILHPGHPVPARKRLPASLRPSSRDVPREATALYADTLGEWVLRFLLERAGAGDAAGALAAEWRDDRVQFFELKGKPGFQVGFLWRVRVSSPEAAARLGVLLPSLYTGRPATVRPTVKVTDDVVEVARLLAPPPEAQRAGR